MDKPQKNYSLYENIRDLILESRKHVLRQVNQAMVLTYFEIGRMIVEDEQEGDVKAKYAEQTLKGLSGQLTKEFGKGFSHSNLEYMRRFYLAYQKSQTVSGKFELSWSHYVFLLKISDLEERSFYEIESAESNWSLRELKRQFNSALFQRLALGKDKSDIKEMAEKGQIVDSPSDLIKDPYILEFLDLDEKSRFTESELEAALIDKLQHFLLELGKGFTFVARQKRISFGSKHFYIDLVFYNRVLQSFILIDLKIGELTHEDLGQMMMYVNFYDRKIKLHHENKTIGLVLCRSKENAVVEYTLPEDNKHIFASQYQMVLPDKEELVKLLQNVE